MGKKGKGKKGKKKDKKEPPQSRDFYLNQISKGRNNLEDIEDLRDNELVKNEQIDEVVSQIDRDKGDITSYLHRMVREMEVEIDLLNKTEKTIIDKDHIESLERRLEDNIKIHTLQKNDLEIEKLKQYGNLKEMSETSFEKKTIEGKIANHEKTLENEKSEFIEELYQSEKASLKRRDGIKLNMISKVKDLTGDFGKISAAQVSNISESAVRKNNILRDKMAHSDTVAHACISKNKAMSAKLDRAQVYTRAFEGIGDHNVATGTIAAFRKENATRTKAIQDLVIEYRDIEEKIETMIDREFDLKDIENSIEKVYASGAVENQTRALEVLKAETYELDSKCRASLKKVEEIENELSSLTDIGRRILSDLEKGSVSRLTAKMLLDVTHDEAIKSDFSPGVMAFVPSC